MLIVNNPGSWGHIYPIFKHAKWNGFGGADWIFPFFLFIIGFAISISFAKYQHSEKSRLPLVLKIGRRSILLFLLGIFLNAFPEFNWQTIRIPGVLQRIALVYFFAATLFLFLERKLILCLSIVLLLIHWFLLTQIPVPGIGTESLEMGKNLAGWIDSYLMPNHLWIHTKTWDPEGILGTLPATSSCLFGLYYGKIFIEENRFSTEQFYFGVFLGILLISLSFVWDIVFPINKGLWTGSYVLITTGLAILVLHLLYDWIDVSKTKVWHKAFEIFGINALSAFFLSSLFSKILNIPFLNAGNGKQIGLKTFLYTQYFTSYFSPYNASFAWALSYTLIWLIFFYFLYKRNVFIKL
jgi:predicted acyltransferase